MEDSDEKVVRFPGMTGKLHQARSDDDEVADANDVLDMFADQTEEGDRVLIMSMGKDGSLGWASNAVDLCEVLWLCKAMERLAMDMSLGIGGYDDE